MAKFRINGIPQSIRDLHTVSSKSGSIATFDTDLTENLVKCVANIQAVQSGSGTPSSTNVRAISGWQNVNVVRCGKNLFDKNQTLSNGFIQSDGSIGTSSSYVYTDYIKVKPNTNYTTSGDVALSNTRNNIACYDKNFAFIERLNTDKAGGWTFTTPNNCNYIRMNLGGAGRDLNTIQLEEGSSATTYEAYNGISVTVALGQTVYGGYLDVISGVLTITNVLIEYDGSSDETWQKVSGTGKFYIVNTDMPSYVEAGKISNIYPFSGEASGGSSAVTVDKSFYTQTYPSQPNYNRVWIYNSDYEEYSNTQFKEVLSNQPIDILVELVTPTTVQLSSNQISTILGQNNIYANTGDIEVKFLETVGNKIGG